MRPARRDGPARRPLRRIGAAGLPARRVRDAEPPPRRVVAAEHPAGPVGVAGWASGRIGAAEQPSRRRAQRTVRQAQVRDRARQDRGRLRTGVEQGQQLAADGRGERGRALGLVLQVAPEPQVDAVGHGPEAGPGRHGQQRDAVPAARVGELGGNGAVGALAGQQRRGLRAAQRGREPAGRLCGGHRVGSEVVGAPPDQTGEHQLALTQVPGGVLQVGRGDPGDLPGQQLRRGPGHLDPQVLQPQQIPDDHVWCSLPSAPVPGLAAARRKCAKAS